eukprot:1897036-Prymnesium_polylepis.1
MTDVREWRRAAGVSAATRRDGRARERAGPGCERAPASDVTTCTRCGARARSSTTVRRRAATRHGRRHAVEH